MTRFLHVFLAAALLASPNIAQSQVGGPPIRFILGVPPGGSLDASARILAARLAELTKRNVVVDNRPGANMLIATKAVSASAPDGNTLLLASAGPITTNPVFYPKESVDPLVNLTPISMIAIASLAVIVHPGVPVKTMKELVEYAKANPNVLNFSTGTTSFQIAMELVMQRTGMRLTHVPYNGAGPALNAVTSGQVQLTVLDVGTAGALIRAGKLRALMVMSDKRLKSLPDVPDARESGYPSLEMETWAALFGPPGMPVGTASRLNEVVTKSLESADIREKFTGMEYEFIFHTPEQLADRIKRESATVKEVIEKANLKPN